MADRILILAVGVLLSVSPSPAAYAGETRMHRDPAVDVPALISKGAIVVRTGRNGARYEADSSAVLSGVSFAKLQANSADVGEFRKMGMPNVKQSKWVVREARSAVAWTEMSMAGQTSRHYLDVQFEGNGCYWELTQKRPSWPHEEDSKFRVLDGSWYMEDLGQGRVYVRYFLSAEIDSSVPDFLIENVLNSQLPASMRKGIRILEERSRE